MTDDSAYAAYGVRRNDESGAFELDPKPADSELGDFYLSKYYELLKSGKRAPDIRRLMEGGENAQRERDWLRHGLYADIADSITTFAPGKAVLDIGCGAGELVEFLKDTGFQACGLEPSELAVSIAREKGLDVYRADLDDFAAQCQHDARRFDAMTLVHVLEHVPDPKKLLTSLHDLLTESGILIVDVPNDFNPLQEAARDALDLEPWWIIRPDHISYFDFDSLASLLQACGYEVTDRYTTFPMELFLLMGRRYTENPELGAKCHAERRSLEHALPTSLRRELYRAFAEIGIGRDCIVVARKAA